MSLGKDITSARAMCEKDGYPYMVEIDFNGETKELDLYMTWIFQHSRNEEYKMYFPQYEVVGFAFKDANEAMFFKLIYG